jgi:hypothetical protein
MQAAKLAHRLPDFWKLMYLLLSVFNRIDESPGQDRVNGSIVIHGILEADME